MQGRPFIMHEKIINQIGGRIHQLRSVIVVDNYMDTRNLDLLVQNFMSIQQVIINNIEVKKSTKYLSVLEKEAQYYLTRYA